MSALTLETLQVVPAGLPADLSGSGLTGDYVSLKLFNRCLVVVLGGDGTAGNDIAAALYQATNVAGDDAKVLNCLETGRIFTKEHASALTGVGQWTEETQATADEQWAPTDSGEQVLLWGLEIMASDLDQANDFDCIRCDISDPGAAKVVSVLYVLTEPRYQEAPADMPSAIID